MPTTTPTLLRHARTLLREARDFLVSLKLTLVLLAFSMLLVFVATLDQVNLGVWAVQEKYFRSFIVYTQVRGVSLPLFPGGYTVGGLLLANLIAAHLFRFSLTWRKLGIQLTHFGLIVLLVGELLTGLWQEDFQLPLTEGQTKNYAESVRGYELAVVDATNPDFDEVTAIPEKLIARKTPIQNARLPFRIVTKTYYPNSTVQMRAAAGATGESASTGFGSQIAAVPAPVTYRQDERNVPSAILEIAGSEGSLGTWLVSPHLTNAQEFTYAGRTWRIALRVRRIYQPFALTLLKFNHDVYPGTNIPKNFSSRLKLVTPDGRDDREVLIYMNNPLRYAGLTFYQAGYDGDHTTVLHVVRNPSWLMPYIACGLMTLGLTLQFALSLFAFVRRRSADRASAAAPVAAKPRAPVPALSLTPKATHSP